MDTLRHWISFIGTTALALLTAFALVGGSMAVSQPTHRAPQQSPHSNAVLESRNSGALTADLLPIVAQTLAARSPDIWSAHITKKSVIFNNPAQHITSSFNQDGARLQFDGAQPAQLGMQLLELRNGKLSYPITGAKPSVRGNRVELAHGHGLTEWYLNSPLGVEQGFTLAKPIGIADSLLLVIGLQGDLAPRLNAGTLEFMNTQGKAVLHYGDLLAYDADHHVLTTHMQLKGHNLLIQVDTAGGRYPIVIDPLFAVVTSLSDTFPSANETFGLSVALSDDGNTALIGAPGLTILAPPATNAGAVLIFTRSSGAWSLAAILYEPTITNHDGFGQSVSLSGDGTRALIGTNAGCPNCGTSGTGAAYLFTESNGTWPSSPTSTFSDPGGQSGDYFGYDVALSGSGNTALIGAFGANYYNPNLLSQAGVAWVFTESGGSWIANPAPVAGLVSNPITAGALVGYSVAISYYGTSALVGAPGINVGGNTSVGAAYLFNRPNGGWSGTPSPSQSFYDPNIRANGNLGSSVAITSDGTSVLIGDDGTHTGVPGVGLAYVFTQSNGTWSGVPSGTLSDQTGSADDFGANVAFSSSNGSVALIGAPYATVSGQSAAGAVYAFVESNGTWPTSPTVSLMDPAAASGDLFGIGLAISSDGSSALAGAFGTTVNSQAGSGKVYALGPAADLSLALASNPVSVIVSHTTTYMLTATNNDTQVTATNLSLTDTLPAGMTYMSASAAGGACNNTSGTVTCTLASLAPQATWQPSITVTATTMGSINDTAAVSASQLDTNMANNTATVTTTVTPPPPVASNGSVTTNAGTAVNGTFTATGTGPLAFAIVAQPGHGTVSITNAATGAFTYTPASGYSGSDSFTFTASNSGGTSNTATESVTVNSAGGGGGGGGGGSGGSSGGGGGGAFGFLSLLLLAPLVRLTKRKV